MIFGNSSDECLQFTPMGLPLEHFFVFSLFHVVNLLLLHHSQHGSAELL